VEERYMKIRILGLTVLMISEGIHANFL
jgi:hypothetical protein